MSKTIKTCITLFNRFKSAIWSGFTNIPSLMFNLNTNEHLYDNTSRMSGEMISNNQLTSLQNSIWFTCLAHIRAGSGSTCENLHVLSSAHQK